MSRLPVMFHRLRCNRFISVALLWIVDKHFVAVRTFDLLAFNRQIPRLDRSIFKIKLPAIVNVLTLRQDFSGLLVLCLRNG